MNLKLIMNLEEFKAHMAERDSHLKPAGSFHETSYMKWSDDQPATCDISKVEESVFPCIVVTTFWDNPNGPYTHTHHFYTLDELGLQLKQATTF